MRGLFSMEGRLGRQSYILWSAGVAVVTYAVAFAIGFALAMVGTSESAASALGFVIGAVGAIVQAFLVVRRFHDLGKAGSNYWLLLIPIYNLYISFVLLLQKGASGPNQYGEDPANA